jgi:hypothetical protein
MRTAETDRLQRRIRELSQRLAELQRDHYRLAAMRHALKVWEQEQWSIVGSLAGRKPSLDGQIWGRGGLEIFCFTENGRARRRCNVNGRSARNPFGR